MTPSVLTPLFIVASTLFAQSGQASESDDVLLEFYFQPVANLQIAIWIEDSSGKHVQDVFVTQATGKLGIANRPGRWDFVSSWRAPYGPRPSALPIWSGRRGKTYPKVVFYDDDASDQESLGWHENSSSPENYFCRPLTPDEHETIAVDSMTCPSPQTFQSDKGKFAVGQVSAYPPRNDLISFDGDQDSADARQFAAVNDLDGVTAATPVGGQTAFVTTMISAEVAQSGPITAWIEVSLESDGNDSYNFDREDDHFVDPKLAAYGVAYLGQPSVVYRLDIDATQAGFTGTSSYAGYGDWNGASKTIHPPDESISMQGGSGADRLREFELNCEVFRWGVYSHGQGGDIPKDTEDCDWGACKSRSLKPVTDFQVEALHFDKVKATFTIPSMPTEEDEDFELSRVRIFYLTDDQTLTEDRLGAAFERSFGPDVVRVSQQVEVEIDQLWGDYNYQFALKYEDKCANASELATASVTTPKQEFQQIDGFCIIATAAYGAPWQKEVLALRWFRDGYLRKSALGRGLVDFYYQYSPLFARAIHPHPPLRAMVRSLVQPIANLAQMGAKTSVHGPKKGSEGEP